MSLGYFIFRKSQPVNQSQHNQVMDMVEDMAEDMHNKAIMGDMHNKAITDLSLLGIKSMILSNDLCRGNIFEISP